MKFPKQHVPKKGREKGYVLDDTCDILPGDQT